MMGEWTEGEVAILLADNAAGLPRGVTAEKLGRTVRSVYDKLHSLGVVSLATEAERQAVVKRWKEIYPRVRDAFLRDITQDVA